ncbi:MAG: hypothetical protein E7560_01870 [Ruminococcaceae bacterium]|nr:hypothetical protein [Oscillospiraceae bacterium]
MNGYDLYEKVLTRLGYVGGNTVNTEQRFFSSFLELCNQIAADLKLAEIKDYEQPLELTPQEAEALCCGTAMLLAFSEGDSNKNKLFTEIYNAKRAALLSKTDYIIDNLPVTESGGN